VFSHYYSGPDLRRQSFVQNGFIKNQNHRRITMISGLIWWIVVGLIAGWAAGKIMKGGGYGTIMDIILGMVGAVVGGWIFNALGIYPAGGIIASIVVAIVGAVLIIWITRLLKKG
jgi:uncharacterized membrane protein YeaQ/YmgE (transglycosylase-associated protein family)